ncbi:zinc-binding protein A33-like isoform X2 [Hemiscyllium ocellatum]|uniref:zinc-binding protein A33-like isoform X2 n=1 Tax=Hemiscyllium ocellatum TaxID=170820 RepID=UPI0029660256|nr:zinc-binding protein A33-like isoform X2 [Hemiscyllium ocellatum]
MADTLQSRSCTQHVSCPLCRGLFADPVALECGHNFCCSCITGLWEREARNSCPECGREFPQRKLTVNRRLANLAERARKVRLEAGARGAKPWCAEHQEAVKLFCETDLTLICYTCRESRAHKSHSFSPLNEAVETFKAQATCLQTHIISQFAEMHRLLTEKEQRLLRELRREEERLLDTMGRNLREIQENLNSIQKEIVEIQQQLEQQDEVAFLKVETARKRRSKEECSQLRLVSDQLCLGQFNSPLQYTVWREMLDSIHPAPASLTLDLDTANPWLLVSEDRTSVRLGDKEQKVPDTPQRFDRGAFVLGSVGFTSGRHYWQVEVANKRWWGVGLASESAPRKGEIDPTPESGFWTVWLFPRQGWVARTAPSLTPLGLDAGPRKVGVLLDYGAGQVSFYNADNMSHVYTYTHPFTGRLYPFFCPGPNDDGSNSAPLSICGARGQ